MPKACLSLSSTNSLLLTCACVLSRIPHATTTTTTKQPTHTSDHNKPLTTLKYRLHTHTHACTYTHTQRHTFFRKRYTRLPGGKITSTYRQHPYTLTLTHILLQMYIFETESEESKKESCNILGAYPFGSPHFRKTRRRQFYREHGR